ncbi:fibronectin type III domain-containing protein [Actinoplanes sp. NEAU-A12]|uniref:Fibronectin type III domain-containing protein n=1 Tax=Actinoplanes sandaracinus TaxID=3045177 RepID=A0ABT6WP82_9ACTN|nr:fibronectin type III domain-containing protein [Actinoplanes sandaracinus]MDI6101533.1 fibronectin type III domain-containing protein [Actinoplanes sandaracinus]
MLGYRKSAVALSAVVLPLLLAGCSSSSGSVREETVDAGRSWIVVDEGAATPSPTTTFGTASPTPETTLPPLPTGSSPTGMPATTCTPMQRITAINGLAVEPGSTSAVVTWYHPGGDNIVDYRVTAISQDLVVGAQKEIGWTRSAPDKCGDVSATVTGLDPQTPYVFSVDVVMTRSNPSLDGIYTETIARSGVVSTT